MSVARVVVTGIGMVTPLGLTVDATWRSLLQGKNGVQRISTFDTDGFRTRIAAEVKNFNPTDSMDRKEVLRTDRFTQFAITASREAVFQSGLAIDDSIAGRVAVIIGSGIGGIMTLSQQLETLGRKGPDRVSPFLMPMMLIDMAAAQVSIAVGAKGPNFSIVSACASGSDSIGEAANMIRRGEVDVAIAGGTEAPICPIVLSGFSACGALSERNDDPASASRPFDAGRDGFVMGEGSTVLLLERLEYAVARGGRPLAELTGYGATSDSSHIVQPGPFGEGGARAMGRALSQSQINPEAIDYINAHGTSTPLNDRAETQAIKHVFGEGAYKIPISATKSMTGHLLGAAGALEAAVCVLAVQHGVVPPTMNLENPDPDCDLDYTPWTPRRGPINAALTNSLGFGGHNSTLIFQQLRE